jgi:outer membrane protein assembly complex protein YaeT
MVQICGSKPSECMLGFFLRISLSNIFIAVIFVLNTIAVHNAYAQTDRSYEVRKIQFEGNRTLKEDQLRSVMQTVETPGSFWKFIYKNISEAVGQKPQYFDQLVFSADYIRLQKLYENKGFFHAQIDTSFSFDDKSSKVSIRIQIQEGRRSYIDTLKYNGLEELPPDIQRKIETNSIVRVGQPYDINVIDAELRRIVTLLANSGYVNAKVENVEAKRYASTNNFTVVYSFSPGERYRFGKISIVYDSLSVEKVDSTIILRHVDFAEGDFYSEEKRIRSERNLNRLGVFDASRIEHVPSKEVTLEPFVPVQINVRTRPFQELAPEIGINDENNAFNVSLGAEYNHRNFWGGARNFSMSLRASIQSIQNFSFKNFFTEKRLKDSSLVARVDFNAQLVQPFFIDNKTSIRSSITGIVDKQRAYYLPVIRWQTGVTNQAATFTKIFLDWNLEYSNPTALATQLDTVIGAYEQQLNSILTFTIQRDKRNDVFYPSEGFFHSLSVEEAGFLPRAFGSSLNITLPYSQYVKSTVLGQWYWDPTEKNKFIWALRGRVGLALLYGKGDVEIPLTQRYFSGGSGSLRGWKARELGIVPRRDLGGNALIEWSLEGRWNPLQNAGSFLFLNLSKFTFVGFFDVGNLWAKPSDIRPSQVAMDGGIGIRYNTVAGPIRIDFGMRVFDPDAATGHQWIYQKIFFKETVASGQIHLGVGHTF